MTDCVKNNPLKINVQRPLQVQFFSRGFRLRFSSMVNQQILSSSMLIFISSCFKANKSRLFIHCTSPWLSKQMTALQQYDKKATQSCPFRIVHCGNLHIEKYLWSLEFLFSHCFKAYSKDIRKQCRAMQHHNLPDSCIAVGKHIKEK